MNALPMLALVLLATVPTQTMGVPLAGVAIARQARALTIRGLDGSTHEVTPRDLARFGRHDTVVTAHHVTGRFSGVALTDLLTIVHAPVGDSLRGPALRTYVRIEGADGYAVLLTLAELDASFTDRIAILTDRKDGAPLTAKDGPYQLIIPGDKRPARWVRQVVLISLERAP